MPRPPARRETVELSENVTALLDAMHKCDNMRELVALSKTDEFKNAYRTSNADEQAAIRENYEAQRDVIQHNVPFLELDGEEITVEDADVVPTQYGEMAIIKGTRANGDRMQTKTSAVRIVTHFIRLLESDMRTEAFPSKYIFRKNPHPDDPSKTMWDFKRIPKSRDNRLPWDE